MRVWPAINDQITLPSVTAQPSSVTAKLLLAVPRRRRFHPNPLLTEWCLVSEVCTCSGPAPTGALSMATPPLGEWNYAALGLGARKEGIPI